MAIDNNSKLVYGGDLMLLIQSGATSGVTYNAPLAFTTSAKLSISHKTRDISSKDSGYWSSVLGGQLSFSITTDGLFSLLPSGTTGFEQLFTKMVAREPINFTFGVKTGTAPAWTQDSTKKYWQGQAIISSLEVSGANNDNTTYSITLDGVGEISMI